MAPAAIRFIERLYFKEPPIPTTSFQGRTVIVTGSNTGLGKDAVRQIINLGASKVIMACRNLEKAKVAAKEIQTTTSCKPETIEVWKLDMSDYSSVKAFATKVTELPRIDAAILNAGLVARTFRITEDNEETITTNVVSTMLLAFLLHPILRKTAKRYETQTNLTLTASGMYRSAKFKERDAPTGKIFDTLNDESKADMGDRYHTSKLLVMMAFRELAAMSSYESSGVIVNYFCPGPCMSELAREYGSPIAMFVLRMVMRKTEVGARTLVSGASSGPETHGQWMPDSTVTPVESPLKGEEGKELQGRVWKELKEKLETIQPGVTSLSGVADGMI